MSKDYVLPEAPYDPDQKVWHDPFTRLGVKVHHTGRLSSAKPEVDMVNHPPHYLKGKVEVIDFIEDQQLGYYGGQVVKYLCRAPHKGQTLQDYQKAQFYLNRLVTYWERYNK